MVNEFYRNVKNMIDQALLDTHTAFLATIISMDIGTCTVQPLCMYKERGKKAQKASVVSNVPMMLLEKTVVYINDDTGAKSIVKEDIKENDVVLCVCCDRDISEAISGNINTPPVGHHNMADSIAVGCPIQIIHIGGDD